MFAGCTSISIHGVDKDRNGPSSSASPSTSLDDTLMPLTLARLLQFSAISAKLPSFPAVKARLLLYADPGVVTLLEETEKADGLLYAERRERGVYGLEVAGEGFRGEVGERTGLLGADLEMSGTTWRWGVTGTTYRLVLRVTTGVLGAVGGTAGFVGADSECLCVVVVGIVVVVVVVVVAVVVVAVKEQQPRAGKI